MPKVYYYVPNTSPQTWDLVTGEGFTINIFNSGTLNLIPEIPSPPILGPGATRNNNYFSTLGIAASGYPRLNENYMINSNTIYDYDSPESFFKNSWAWDQSVKTSSLNINNQAIQNRTFGYTFISPNSPASPPRSSELKDHGKTTPNNKRTIDSNKYHNLVLDVVGGWMRIGDGMHPNYFSDFSKGEPNPRVPSSSNYYYPNGVGIKFANNFIGSQYINSTNDTPKVIGGRHYSIGSRGNTFYISDTGHPNELINYEYTNQLFPTNTKDLLSISTSSIVLGNTQQINLNSTHSIFNTLAYNEPTYIQIGSHFGYWNPSHSGSIAINLSSVALGPNISLLTGVNNFNLTSINPKVNYIYNGANIIFIDFIHHLLTGVTFPYINNSTTINRHFYPIIVIDDTALNFLYNKATTIDIIFSNMYNTSTLFDIYQNSSPYINPGGGFVTIYPKIALSSLSDLNPDNKATLWASSTSSKISSYQLGIGEHKTLRIFKKSVPRTTYTTSSPSLTSYPYGILGAWI